ncbi:MAG: type II secretion system F family protein [Acidobacteria bacterium]|nr:type II secretion system F family protein [Acidobacteriota bacterium]
MPAWVIVIFLVMFAIVTVAVSVGLRFLEVQQKKRVAGAVAVVKEELVSTQTESVLRAMGQDNPWDAPAGVLAHFDVFKTIEEKVEQSALGWNAAAVVVAMATLGVLGVLLGYVFPVLVFRWASMIGLGLGLGWLPWFWILFKRSQRMDEFEQQFPESLDFLARSLRAGHAFSMSLEMLSQESPAPLGPEFARVFHEHNLGAPLEVALYNLTQRVPLLDVRFFVSSVMLQRETGGNLGEILTKLSYVIRERFRLKGQVRAASAHGRLTATVLILLPIVLVIALFIIAPDYLQSMADDDTGQWMILGALVGQILGFYFIRKIINIKV